MKPAPIALIFMTFLALAGCHHHNPVAEHEPLAATAPTPPPPRPYLLHLPGIGGARSIDRMLTQGLVQGGMDVDLEIHDWTATDAGLSALYARQRHEHEADVVARIITDKFRADPRTKIYLSGHSGGTGIA